MTSSKAQSRPTRLPNVPYRLTRLGIIMSADPSDPYEVEGVLNPATAWGTDGELYLYPRLVAEGNVSRVGKARVVLVDGVPTGVERQGVVLEPVRSWERGVQHGGVEDPRITWMPSLDVHVMTYVAFGPFGPRPAVAISHDLEQLDEAGTVPVRVRRRPRDRPESLSEQGRPVLPGSRPGSGRSTELRGDPPSDVGALVDTQTLRPFRPARPILVPASGSRTFRRRTCGRTSRRSRAREDIASWPAPSSSGRASRWGEDRRRSEWTRAGS